MYGILVDVTRCTGCERCVSACVAAHADGQVKLPRSYVGGALSEEQLLYIQVVEEGRFARKSCMHCVEPSCVSACLVGGITKSPDGPVVYDPDKCIGCRYCMLSCPHHIPRYEWSKTTPFMKKCDMCADRLAHGQRPSCVEACPNDALRFGERSRLLAEAHKLIDGQPGRYLPRVWGEHEWGGTSVMYISDVDLSVLDFPQETAAPIPSLTDPLIEKTPYIGGGAAVGLWALGAIIARRNEVMVAERSGRKEKRGND